MAYQARHFAAQASNPWWDSRPGVAARFVVAAGLAGAIAATPALALAEEEAATTADTQQAEQATLVVQSADELTASAASATEETSATTAETAEGEATTTEKAESAEDGALSTEAVATTETPATEASTTEVATATETPATEAAATSTATATETPATTIAAEATTTAAAATETAAPATENTQALAAQVESTTTTTAAAVSTDTAAATTQTLAAQASVSVPQGSWVVDARSGSLQRYWVWSDGTVATNMLITPENGAGYYAWATADGTILRGKWDTGAGRVYVADNDGRLLGSDLTESGWVVTNHYDGRMQRYWVDVNDRAAVSGFFTVDDYGDVFGKGGEGYVVRGDFQFGGRKWSSDNDGKLRSGWYVTNVFDGHMERYWLGDTAYGSAHAASTNKLVGSAGYYGYATSDGTVLRGRYDTSAGRVYVADNDGKLLGSDLTSDGWVVTNHYDGRMQRYWVDASDRAAVSGYFTVAGYGSCWGEGNLGYLRRNASLYFQGKEYWADNDGILVEVTDTQLNGIDISSWQAGINLSAVPGDFVIVKATQGTTYVNPEFLTQANATLSAGKLLGLYHFADTSKGATAEADFFVKNVSSYVGQAVLVLDWENNDISGQDNLSSGVSYAKTFLDRVYAQTGVKPLIYMSRSVTNEYNWSSVSSSGYGLWMAQYLNKYYSGTDGYVDDPTMYYDDSEDGENEWDSPLIYQYTPSGKLSGYSGNLDLDVFYGSKADWKNLAKKLK